MKAAPLFSLAVLAVAGLALIAGCAEREPFPPGTPPEIALPVLAAEGNADAQVSLGYMYQTGQSFEQSYSEAARWYQRAAEQGNDLAQFALGELYTRGLGLEQNYRAAAVWFRRAAVAGNVSAQYQLAYLYENGLGLPRDYGAAALWYGRAGQGTQGLTPPPGLERLTGRAYAATRLVPPVRQDAAVVVTLPNDRTAPVLIKPQQTATAPASADGVWVHLASLRSLAAAKALWETLRQRHAILLGRLTSNLTPLNLGAEIGIWVRVQAGPLANATVAQSLCNALNARGAYCALVTWN